jgi:hypothetical protein
MECGRGGKDMAKSRLSFQARAACRAIQFTRNYALMCFDPRQISSMIRKSV